MAHSRATHTHINGCRHTAICARILEKQVWKYTLGHIHTKIGTAQGHSGIHVDAHTNVIIDACTWSHRSWRMNCSKVTKMYYLQVHTNYLFFLYLCHKSLVCVYSLLIHRSMRGDTLINMRKIPPLYLFLQSLSKNCLCCLKDSVFSCKMLGAKNSFFSPLAYLI